MTLRTGALLVSLLATAGAGLGAQNPATAQTPAAQTPPAPRPVTAVDVKMAHRLREILATRAAWNQTDHQNCATGATSFGLYCALEKAQQDTTGTFDHDAIIMNEARDVIDFVTAKDYNARLVGYNNDPETSFGDIQAFAHILENRLTRRLATPPAAAGPATCTFTRASTGWTGSCGRVFGEQPEFALAPSAAITTGAWRTDARPTGVWAGSVTNASKADAPVELEIYTGGTGVLRTLFGWFPVTNFQADPLHFSLDGDHEVPPNAVDRQILERASTILASEAVWDRHDTRDCPATATSWSIYCSVVRASVDILGAYHHRRPAAQLVRAIIDERTTGKDYQHRLMDYNNDPTTHLSDVKSLFAEAIARIK